jgi:hypothetical protein
MSWLGNRGPIREKAMDRQESNVKIAIDDIEVVDGKQPYLRISAPSVIESVRALRVAAGLDTSANQRAAGTP